MAFLTLAALALARGDNRRYFNDPLPSDGPSATPVIQFPQFFFSPLVLGLLASFQRVTSLSDAALQMRPPVAVFLLKFPH